VITNFGRALMLDALDESATNGIKFLSLHTAYSATGTNEATGGSPAYARKAATWSAASGTSKALTSGVTFDVAAGTYSWLGGWDAITAGNLIGMWPLGGAAKRAFNVSDAADVTANTIDSPAHGLVAGNSVVVWNDIGASLPTGLSEGTIYFVIATGLTTDVFELSATLGGSAIDITANGDGAFQPIVPEVFAAQGQYNVSAHTLTSV
jgi:hypothetical protein